MKHLAIKCTAVYLAAVLFVGVVASLLYTPVWNHNQWFAGVILALAVVQFGIHIWKKQWLDAGLYIAGTSTLVFAVWSHNVPLIIAVSTLGLIVGAIAMARAVQGEMISPVTS